MSRLSQNKKRKLDPFLDERDGTICLFCKEGFTAIHPYEYEHLNNNYRDSRPENIVKAHHECNVRKIRNPEFQVIAHEKLRENERQAYVCERTLADTGMKNDLTSCQEISKTNTNITKQFLLEHTLNGNSMIVKDAVNAIVNLCQENNHTGSQAAIYRYVESYTNPINGLYTICNAPKGENIIRKRIEN